METVIAGGSWFSTAPALPPVPLLPPIIPVIPGLPPLLEEVVDEAPVAAAPNTPVELLAPPPTRRRRWADGVRPVAKPKFRGMAKARATPTAGQLVFRPVAPAADEDNFPWLLQCLIHARLPDCGRQS